MEEKYYDIGRKRSARVTVPTSATGIARNLCETLKLPKPTPPSGGVSWQRFHISRTVVDIGDIRGCSDMLPDAQSLPIS